MLMLSLVLLVLLKYNCDVKQMSKNIIFKSQIFKSQFQQAAVKIRILVLMRKMTLCHDIMMHYGRVYNKQEVDFGPQGMVKGIL